MSGASQHKAATDPTNEGELSKSRSTAFRTSKNTVMLFAGAMTRMVASFAFVIYCADQLGVEGFGKYSIAIHYFELLLSLTATAAGILLTRELAKWPNHTAQLTTSAIVLVLLLWVGSPFMLWGIGLMFGYSPDTRLAIVFASVALVPAAICSVLEAVFVAKERAEFVTAGTAIESLARIVLSFTALFLGYGLLTLVGLLCVVRTLMLVAYLVGMHRMDALRWKFSVKQTWRFFKRWRVFAAENWMATVYTNLDVIVLSWISGEVAAGLYSAAWKIVRLGSVFAKSYTTAVFPLMSRMFKRSQAALAQLNCETIRYMCVLAFPVIALVSVIPDRIIGLLFSSEFDAAAPVLRVLIWVLAIEFLNPFLSHLLFAKGQQRNSMHVATISLLVNGVVTYMLVRNYGAIGAALGTVLGGLVATVCYSFFAFSKSELISSAAVAARVVVAAIAVSMVAFSLRDSAWVVLLTACGVAYGLTLIIVGAVRVADLRSLSATLVARTAS